MIERKKKILEPADTQFIFFSRKSHKKSETSNFDGKEIILDSSYTIHTVQWSKKAQKALFVEMKIYPTKWHPVQSQVILAERHMFEFGRSQDKQLHIFKKYSDSLKRKISAYNPIKSISSSRYKFEYQYLYIFYIFYINIYQYLLYIPLCTCTRSREGWSEKLNNFIFLMF